MTAERNGRVLYPASKMFLFNKTSNRRPRSGRGCSSTPTVTTNEMSNDKSTYIRKSHTLMCSLASTFSIQVLHYLYILVQYCRILVLQVKCMKNLGVNTDTDWFDNLIEIPCSQRHRLVRYYPLFTVLQYMRNEAVYFLVLLTSHVV